MSSWLSSVLGAVGQTKTLADARETAPQGDDKEQPQSASAASSQDVSIGFADRVTYWTSVAASVGSSLAKDSGFAMIDRVAEELDQACTPVGDAGKELNDIEASCKAITSGVAEPSAVWKGWAARMGASQQERFYDSQAHEDVSLKTLILRSSALNVAVTSVLRKPSCASDQDQSLLALLDHILVGERADKEEAVRELVKLAEVVDGTASHDKIQALVLSSLSEAKSDYRYEDTQRECTDLLQQTTSKERELLALPRLRASLAPADDAADNEAGESPVVGAELGDEEVRKRVVRSSELLDNNASLRHLVTIGGALLRERAVGASVGQHALQEISVLRENVLSHSSSVKSRIEGATDERNVVKEVLQVSLKSVKACLVESVQEAMATESRLRKTEDTVSQRLDRLVDKRRQLQAELEVVQGEILSCEQQLAETQRDLDMLPRQTESKDKNLVEQLQALGVQVQDSENEMDALDETGLFVQKIAALVDKWIVQQSADVTETRQRVQADEQRFILLHLQHQAAQLVLLRDSLQFCTEELSQSETKTSKISKLGMTELVTEEGTRVEMLHQRKDEASKRVLAIGQDVEDLKSQILELGRDSIANNETLQQMAAADALRDDGRGTGAARSGEGSEAARSLTQILNVVTKLEQDLGEVLRMYKLEGEPVPLDGNDSCASEDRNSRTQAPHFSPLPPRPPATEELAGMSHSPRAGDAGVTKSLALEVEEEESNSEEQPA